MDKYLNKYRNSSARLQNWDYRSPAAYFITICTQNREHYFGNVVDGKMHLSEIGIVAENMWHEIKNHAHDIELDAFVVMPNHIHGILILTVVVGAGHALPLLRHALPLRHALALQQRQPSIGKNRFQNIGNNSVSSIIGSYKSAVTKQVHRMGFDFAWQTRFYDHIIHDKQSFYRIQTYIFNNPKKWAEDILPTHRK